jgi:hypothetical protein
VGVSANQLGEVGGDNGRQVDHRVARVGGLVLLARRDPERIDVSLSASPVEDDPHP